MRRGKEGSFFEQRRRTAVSGAFVAAVALGTSAKPVRAQARAEPLRITYAAPADCPDEASFFDQVRARTSRVRRAGPDEPSRTLVVVVEEGDGQTEAKITIRDEDGREAARTVSGRTCREVVDAMALIAAVAIDPQASLSPQAVHPAHAAPPPSIVPPPPALLAGQAPPPPERAAAPKWHLGAGAQLAATTGVAPDPLVGLRGFVELARIDPAPANRVGQPTFRISFMHAGDGQAEAGGARAKLTWTAGRLEGCPLRWPAQPPIGVQPCGFVDLGALTADGEGGAIAKTEIRTWAAPGGLLRVQWLLFGVLLVEAEGGASFPLATYRFYFGPDTTLHEVPHVVATLGIGLGARFP